MLYLTCTTVTSVELAHYRVSRAKGWVSVDCGTMSFVIKLYPFSWLVVLGLTAL